jgi:hypothetical protein
MTLVIDGDEYTATRGNIVYGSGAYNTTGNLYT